MKVQQEAGILDAPNVREDFYVNIMDWGINNTLAVASGSTLHLWNSETMSIKTLFEGLGNDFLTSVAWSEGAGRLAVGYNQSALQIWDVETSKCVSSCSFKECPNAFDFRICWLSRHYFFFFRSQIQSLVGHGSRVAAISWKGRTVTSGNDDGSIINHDGT